MDSLGINENNRQESKNITPQFNSPHDFDHRPWTQEEKDSLNQAIGKIFGL